MCACMYACMHVNFSRTVWPHWGVLTASVKAGCSFEVVSMCLVVAYPISPVFFSHKMALVTCPCAFGLRWLARNGCPGIGVLHFSSKFSHKKKKNSCEMSVCISTAQARTKCASRRSWDRSPSWTSSILSFIIFLLLNIHILIFLSSSSSSSSSSPAAAAASTASPSSSSSSSSSSSLS